MDRTSFRIFLIVILLIIPLSVLAQEAEEEEEPVGYDPERAKREFEFGYQAYHADANFREARSRFETALKADSSYYRAMYGLGRVYYALGLNRQAIETWEEGMMASGYIRAWFRRELESHRLRYSRPEFKFQNNWNYIGKIDGAVAGRRRSVNPSAIVFLSNGNFLASSLRMGHVFQYSPQGSIEKKWRGFSRPVDMQLHPRLGVLVAEYGADRITRITHAGEKVEFAADVRAPRKVLSVGGKIYYFNDAAGELVRLTEDGDTVAAIWSETPLNRISDLAVGPDDRFWLLDERRNSFHVVDKYGEVEEEISFDARLDVSALWFQEDNLILATAAGLVVYDTETGQQQPLYEEGDAIPADDLSDIAFYGDRMVLSLFEESSLLIYRQPEAPDPDILIQDRRTRFQNYPMISQNLIITDPLGSGRYRDLSDRSLGIEVENMTALPSLLRHSSEVYDPGWIMIIDNRLDSERTWRELQLFLEELITDAPKKSIGTIWQVEGKNVVRSYTSNRATLRNSLQSVYPVASPVDAEDTEVLYLLDQAFNNDFSRRGPTGIIIVSQNLPENGPELQRLAYRSRNNFVPVVLINPTIETLSPTHPFSRDGEFVYINYDNMNSEAVWDFYNDHLDHHYTAIFRSPIAMLQSGEWHTYEFVFHYLTDKFRFESGYLLP